jgi:hypothetical protein
VTDGALSRTQTRDPGTLCARYNFAVDNGDPEAWADTFTEDGVFCAIRNGIEVLSFRGAEALRANARSNRERKARGRHGRHFSTSHISEGDGDRATHRSYCLHLVVESGNAPTVHVMGTYSDTLKRVNGKWRFVRREFTEDA